MCVLISYIPPSPSPPNPRRRLLYHETPAAASQYIATYLASRITLHTPSKPFILGLPTGSTPPSIYASLVGLHRAGQLSFRNVITFHLDGEHDDDVPASRSSNTYVHENFFRRIDIAPENVHFPGEEGCRAPGEYGRLIRSLGGAEVVLCGVAETPGRVAAPHDASEASRARVVPLAVPTLLANRRHVEREEVEVSETAGVATMLESNELIIVAFGKEKAAMVKDAVEGPGDLNSPLGMLLLKHKNAVLVVDKEAAENLSANTLEVCPPLTLTPSLGMLMKDSISTTPKKSTKSSGTPLLDLLPEARRLPGFEYEGEEDGLFCFLGIDYCS